MRSWPTSSFGIDVLRLTAWQLTAWRLNARDRPRGMKSGPQPTRRSARRSVANPIALC